jgi:GMP synthase-like glutamine amidotransferase
MKFIRKFNEGLYKPYRMKSLPHVGDPIHSNGDISIFQQDWFEKLLPETLTITSLGKDYVFEKNEATINGDVVQFSYYTETYQKPEDALKDGEPSFLEFDLHFFKNEKNIIKIIVNITYGDAMASEFSIEPPNKINIIHYNGIGSKYDSETHWGFKDESIKDLIKFFNSFNHGVNLEPKDLAFIDEYPDSYSHNDHNPDHLYTDDSNLIEFGNSYKESINKDILLVIDNTKEPEKKYLPKIINYLKSRDIDYKVANTVELLKEYNSNFNIIGALSSGSDFRVKDSENTLLNETALDILKCPIISMCFGFQSMSKHYGSDIAGGEEVSGQYLLDNWDKNCPIFKGVDLDNQKVSFCFHDYPLNCPEGFSVIAELDGKISGISSGDKFGILFHPEEMESTYIILDNFINMCKPIEQSLKYLQTFEYFSKKFN